MRKSAGAGTAILNGAFNSTHPTFVVDAGHAAARQQQHVDRRRADRRATGARSASHRENDCCFAIRDHGTLTGSGGGASCWTAARSTTAASSTCPGYFHARGGTLRDVENAGTMSSPQAHVTSNFVNSGTINQTGDTAGGYSSNVVNAGTWNLAGNSGLFSTANNNFRNTGTVRRTGGRRGHDHGQLRQPRDGRGALGRARRSRRRRSLVAPEHQRRQLDRLRHRRADAFPTCFGIETSAGEHHRQRQRLDPGVDGPRRPAPQQRHADAQAGREREPPAT